MPTCTPRAARSANSSPWIVAWEFNTGNPPSPRPAGTPDECREQFKRYEGLLDHVLLYPPSVGVRAERVRENYRAIADVFGGEN